MPGTRRVVAVAALAFFSVVAAGCNDGNPSTEPTRPAGPAGPILLSLSVYGPPQVVTAYAELASRFSVANAGVTVSVRPFGTAAQARSALATQIQERQVPDAFLAPLGDVPDLVAARRIQRVDQLLGERDVDFGDGYQRSPLEAFSADDALQCMPMDVSPMVVYYNTDLIDLAKLTEPDETPVDAIEGWNLTQFAAAAQSVTGNGKRGVYVAPNLQQIAPFIASGGGALVDDVANPTALQLASGASASALEKLLEVVRDPSLTFDEDEIAAVSADERFRAGELGMLFGFRDLTPSLRTETDLDFDVMPLPRIGGDATVGRSSGLCLSAATLHPEETADFLAYAASDDAGALLAETGYVVPTNLAAAYSTSFLQPGRDPANAGVFSAAVRDIRPMPTVDAWSDVVRMATPLLTELFYAPVIDPLRLRLEVLDNASVALLLPAPGSSPTSE